MNEKKNNKNKRKLLIVLLVLLLVGACVGGWFLLKDKSAEPEKPGPAPVNVELPKTTSTEAKLYVADKNGKLAVVNFDGAPADGYTVNEDGHIADTDGKILVAKKNVETYFYAIEIQANVEKIEMTEGDAPVELKLTVLPDNATNPECRITVADEAVAKVAGNEVTAAAAGETELVIACGEVELKIPVVVTKKDGASEPEDPTEPTEPAPVEPTPAPTPAPHTHSYTDTRTEPTCTADGKVVSKCSCGDAKTTVIPKLGHDYKQVSRTEPTTTAEGKIVKKCSRCGDTKTETIPKLTPTEPINPEPVHTHKYTDTRTEPTCTADGKVVSKCSCGDTKTTVIPALGHDHSIPVYETRTYEVVTGYEPYTYCCGCQADLPPDLLGAAFDAHIEAHALKGESTQTISMWREIVKNITEQVLTGHKCSRCGHHLPV